MTNKKDYHILKIDLKRLSSILNKIYAEYRNGNIKIELDPFTAGIGMSTEVKNEFLDEFELSEDNFEGLTSDILFLITMLVMNEEENIFKKYGESDKTKKILEIFKQWSQKFPDLLKGLRFKLFCKTQYLENLTWEVSTKTKQNGGIEIEFSVSVIRMSFLKPSTSIACPLNKETTVTFECTLEGIRDIIKSLKEVERALEELEGKGKVR